MSVLSLDDELRTMSSLYSSYRIELLDISDEITAIFTDFLKKYAFDFDLTYQNSAYPGFYFTFSPRVKSVESFSEKLVRSSEVLSLLNQSEEHKLAFLHSADDLLGLKILGELEADVISIFSLISSREKYLNDKGISFHSSFALQPVSMKNGLEIFKLNCTYNNGQKDFPFELQIKSKLLSAWGDMEHSIFYKDYSGTAIRTSIQRVMNDVGKSLHSLDALLFSIRGSNKDYLNQRDYLQFLERIQNCFSEEVQKYMGTKQNFDLNKIVSLLYNFDNIDKKKESFSFDSLIIPELTISDTSNEEQKLRIFLELKKFSIPIRILEFIYTVYMDNMYEDDESKRSKIHVSNLTVFLEEYKKVIIRTKSNVKFLEELINNNRLNEVFDFIFINSKNEDVLFLSNNYKHILQFFSYIDSQFSEEVGDIEDFNEDFLVPGLDAPKRQDNSVYYNLVKLLSLYVFEKKSMNDSEDLFTKEEFNELKEKHKEVAKLFEFFLEEVGINTENEYEQIIIQFANLNSWVGSEEE